MTPDLKFYRWGTALISPLLPLYLRRRVRKGKEHGVRYTERYGKTSVPRPEGPLVWFHAASVGESVMLLPLLKKFRVERADMTVLLTTGTLTSANLMAERLPKGVIHQFAPADTVKSVRRFLDHWKPDLAIWAESEIWPNLIMETRERDIPTALINARMSASSLEGWAKRKPSAQFIFGNFDLIQAADDATANGLTELAGRDVEVAGNLKYAAAPLRVIDKHKDALTKQIGTRPVWAAASTHHGEESLIANLHMAVRGVTPDALLILAPRHPERADVIKAILEGAGHNVAQRSKEEPIMADTNIYLFDTLGEMGLVYSLAPVSVICGSLTPGLSGHNPLEPARLGSAILSGGNVSSFADVYSDLTATGGAVVAKDSEAFETALFKLLGDKKLRGAQVKAARKLAASQDGVLAAVWRGLTPLMPIKTTS